MQIVNIKPVFKKTVLPIVIASAALMSPMIINQKSSQVDRFEYSTNEAQQENIPSKGVILSGLWGLFGSRRKKEEETNSVEQKELLEVFEQQTINNSHYFDIKLDKDVLRNLYYNRSQASELQSENVDKFFKEVQDNILYQDACTCESLEMINDILEMVKVNPQKYLSADYSCNVHFVGKYRPLENILKSCIQYVVDTTNDREEFRTEYLPEYREMIESVK